MSRLIFPLFLILLAVIIVFYFGGTVLNGSTAGWAQKVFLTGSGDGLRALMAEKDKLNNALTNARKLKERIAELKNAEKTISQDDHKRLDKFIPDRLDNIGLILDINNIASRHGMSLKSIQVDDGLKNNDNSAENNEAALGGDQIAETRVSFVVGGTYESLLRFVSDLADSRQVADVGSLSFSVDEKSLNQYDVELKTYWVK